MQQRAILTGLVLGRGGAMRNLLRMFRQRHWRAGLGAVLLALTLALTALAYWYFAAPARFRVAVGPRDSVEARLIDAFAEALAHTRRDIRLDVVVFDDVRQSAEALRQHKVDLAVVRPDVFLPDNGLTLSILREEAVIVLAPKASKIEDMADLEKKRLGVVTHHEADFPVLTTILAHYDLSSPKMTLVPLRADEVGAALTGKTIDALVFIAAPVGKEASGLVQSALKATQNVALVPIKDAEALALKWPALTSMTVPAGSLSGRPELPDDEFKTLGVCYRLMGRPGLDRSPVSKVTQYLFQMRSRIAQATPAV